MEQRRPRLWIATLVLIATLVAPASLWASTGAEPTSPLGFWQSFQQLWLEWSMGWSGSDATEGSTVRASAAADEDESGDLDVMPLNPPFDPQMFESEGNESDGDAVPGIDPGG